MATLSRALKPVLAVLAIAIAAWLVVSTGVTDLARDEEQLEATVTGAGTLGPVLFLGLMALLVPLNVPGLVFVLPSTVLFGTVGGFVLSLAGGFAASAIGVVGARRLGRSAFESRMPERIRRLERRVSAHGFWGVVALRSFTFLLQPADWLCGISSIPLRTVLAATFVGLIPPTLVLCLGGGEIIQRLR